MLDKRLIDLMLDMAVQAPSGDNAQPWEFKLDGESILLINVPGKDATLYNFKERGSYIAHGAAIENICVTGAAQGLTTTVDLFPGGENVVARLSFAPGAKHDELLEMSISKRCTNRKPYLLKNLDPDDRAALEQSVTSIVGPKLHIADGENVKALSECVCRNEQLLFENKGLHEFLFSMIRWTREEEMRASGLYVKTMEFPLPLQFLLRFVFSNFSAVSAFNLIGLSRFIPKQSALVYKSSSAFLAITISGDSNAEFVNAGRAMQRLWLTAQQRSMNVQPTAGIPYLAERVRAGEGQAFSSEHQQIILETSDKISSIFDIKEGRIAMLMRVGYGSDPSARSLKFAPKLVS